MFVYVAQHKQKLGLFVESGTHAIQSRCTVLAHVQSGQLQDSLISPGEGNKPSPVRQTRSMTPFDKRPCRSSTNESTVPAQSRQIAFQRAAGTGAMEILTV